MSEIPEAPTQPLAIASEDHRPTPISSRIVDNAGAVCRILNTQVGTSGKHPNNQTTS